MAVHKKQQQQNQQQQQEHDQQQEQRTHDQQQQEQRDNEEQKQKIVPKSDVQNDEQLINNDRIAEIQTDINNKIITTFEWFMSLSLIITITQFITTSTFIQNIINKLPFIPQCKELYQNMKPIVLSFINNYIIYTIAWVINIITTIIQSPQKIVNYIQQFITQFKTYCNNIITRIQTFIQSVINFIPNIITRIQQIITPIEQVEDVEKAEQFLRPRWKNESPLTYFLSQMVFIQNRVIKPTFNAIFNKQSTPVAATNP